MESAVRRATYLGSIVQYDVEATSRILALVEHDPHHTTVHSEGQVVRLRFLEDCLCVLRQV